MLVRSIPCAKSSILCDLAKTESQSERAGFLFCENASVSRNHGKLRLYGATVSVFCEAKYCRVQNPSISAKTKNQSERAGFLFCENASVSRAVTVETIMILWYD